MHFHFIWGAKGGTEALSSLLFPSCLWAGPTRHYQTVLRLMTSKVNSCFNNVCTSSPRLFQKYFFKNLLRIIYARKIKNKNKSKKNTILSVSGMSSPTVTMFVTGHKNLNLTGNCQVRSMKKKCFPITFSYVTRNPLMYLFWFPTDKRLCLCV